MTNAAIEYHLSTPTDLFIRNKLIVRIPIELDFNDEEAKSAIYESWRRERNLPYFYSELDVYKRQLLHLVLLYRMDNWHILLLHL